MAIKSKKYSGVDESKKVGLFDTRLSKGQAAGLSRGTAKLASGRTDVVNRQRYKIKQYG